MFFGSRQDVQADLIDGTSVRNASFEDVGFDPGDGLRSTAFWNYSTLRAARAFAGRDGISTGSNGYMRLITEGSDRGETFQDFEGTTALDTLYNWSATAYHTPNSQGGLADYEVTMKLFEVGRSSTVGGTIVDHAAPIELDSETITISTLGGTAPIGVSYLDDGTGLDLKLRIQFESASALGVGIFTRGGVDDVAFSASVVPEPAGTIAIVFGLGACFLKRRRR